MSATAERLVSTDRENPVEVSTIQMIQNHDGTWRVDMLKIDPDAPGGFRGWKYGSFVSGYVHADQNVGLDHDRSLIGLIKKPGDPPEWFRASPNGIGWAFWIVKDPNDPYFGMTAEQWTEALRTGAVRIVQQDPHSLEALAR